MYIHKNIQLRTDDPQTLIIGHFSSGYEMLQKETV